MATYVGLMTAFGAFSYAAYIIYKTLAYGDPVRGYPSLMVVMLFLGGMQLIGIGMLGEYLGRMFNETKGRPLYLVNRYQPSSSGMTTDPVKQKVLES
jgi:glycosyltransferase involved in cell wall biosynthesis